MIIFPVLLEASCTQAFHPQMRTPFLEDYLRKDPITLQKYQLLWQFYIKNNQPLRAAEVLAALAETTQFVLLTFPPTTQMPTMMQD
jgi:hypothetical protein